MLDSGLSHECNDVPSISPEVEGPSLPWKELGTKMSKSRFNGVTGVPLRAV